MENFLNNKLNHMSNLSETEQAVQKPEILCYVIATRLSSKSKPDYYTGYYSFYKSSTLTPNISSKLETALTFTSPEEAQKIKQHLHHFDFQIEPIYKKNK